VGIFEVDGNPTTQDTGVPIGSICLDYSTPGLWHKYGPLTSDWILIGASLGLKGTGVFDEFIAIDGRTFTITDGLISAVKAALKFDFDSEEHSQYVPLLF